MIGDAGDMDRLNLPAAIERLYEVFRPYERPEQVSPCRHCYSEEEIEQYRASPLRESADHWESTAAYKHYLPRPLEVLAPPQRELELYPEHLFETLNAHDFSSWPASERKAVVDFVQAFQTSLPAQEADEWRAAASILAGRSPS